MSVDEICGVCHSGNLARVKELVDVVGVNCQDDSGYSALMCSTVYNTKNIFYFLLSQPGVDVNITSNDGNTALHLAAFLGIEEKVRVLANKDDINLEIKNKWGKTAKDVAAKGGHGGVVSIIEEAEKRKKEGRVASLEENLLAKTR